MVPQKFPNKPKQIRRMYLDNMIHRWKNIPLVIFDILSRYHRHFLLRWEGAEVAEWLSSWLAEQEDRGSIPRLATWIFRDWLSPASKSRYGWKIAKSTLIKKKTTNQPTYWDGCWTFSYIEVFFIHFLMFFVIDRATIARSGKICFG